MAAKPIILPDTFSGDTPTSLDEWIVHFNNCAEVNEWDATAKLKFPKVRLVGKAQSAFQRLPDTGRDTFDHAVTTLKERFEPSSKRDLYLAEFATRKRRPRETWTDFGEDLRRLAIKAYPDLDIAATEQIALTHFIANIIDPQISFAVKQKTPKSLDKAVSTTIQIESYQMTFHMISQSNSYSVTGTPETVSDNSLQTQAVTWKTGDKLEQLLTTITTKLENLETCVAQQQPSIMPQRTAPPCNRNPRQIFCHNCGKEGHFARGCALPRQRHQGNEKPSA